MLKYYNESVEGVISPDMYWKMALSKISYQTNVSYYHYVLYNTSIAKILILYEFSS